MAITAVDVFPVLLPMKRDFRISRGSVTGDKAEATHVYVRISDDTGHHGWGEARPSRKWSYETWESVESTIRCYLGPAIVGAHPENLLAITRMMDNEIALGPSGGQPIAKAAIDMALHDLIGKQAGKPLAELWFSRPASSARLSYLISATHPDEARRQAEIARDGGFSGIDLKIGFDPAIDLEIVEAVSDYARDIFFRVDANQGYTSAQALQVGKKLADFGVQVFEQPLRAGDFEQHRELRRRLDVPIALDEGIWTAGDVVRAIRVEACDFIVIKATKMAGLRAAKLCGEIALEAGMSLLGGGLTESLLALTASAHLFHYLNIQTPVDLNGPFFLADQPFASIPAIVDGTIPVSQGPGIGIEPDWDKVESYGARI